MSTKLSEPVPLNSVCSHRAELRRAFCQCLEPVLNIKVCCGKVGSWKIGTEVSEEFAGVNIRTRRLVRNPNDETISGRTPAPSGIGDPGCFSGACMYEDELRLLVDLEIVVLTCEHAMEFAEVVSDVTRSQICKHQSCIPVHKIDFVGSSDDFDRDVSCDYFTLVDTYELRYLYNHCRAKIQRPEKC